MTEAEYRKLKGEPEPEPIRETTTRTGRRTKEKIAVRAQGPHLTLPGDEGYWSFMTGTIFILFIFYIAGKGELQKWIDVLVWNPAKAPKSEGAGQAPEGTPPPEKAYGPGGTAPAPPEGNFMKQFPGGGTITEGLQKFFGGWFKSGK